MRRARQQAAHKGAGNDALKNFALEPTKSRDRNDCTSGRPAIPIIDSSPRGGEVRKSIRELTSESGD